MRRLLPLLSCITLTAALGACAPVAGRPAGSFDDELTLLRQEQQALTEQQQLLQSNLVLLEARVHDQQQVLDEIRQALKVLPPGGLPSSEGAVPGAGTLPAPPPGASPTEIYLQAFGAYTAGQLEQAAAGFESFLNTFPGNDYAGNAHYWLGECYFAQKQFDRAVQEFELVAERHADGGRAPDALLKSAAAWLQLGYKDRAQEAISTLRRRFPDSQAARKSLQGINVSNGN